MTIEQMDKIVETTAKVVQEVMGIEDIYAERKRDSETILARKMCWYILHTQFEIPYTSISVYFNCDMANVQSRAKYFSTMFQRKKEWREKKDKCLELLKDVIEEYQKSLRIPYAYEKTVSEVFGQEHFFEREGTNRWILAASRQVCYYLCRSVGGYRNVDISNKYKESMAMVSHSINKVTRRIQQDKILRGKVEEAENILHIRLKKQKE